jgi:alpha-tubulin suppressor-like RCC1 family protein
MLRSARLAALVVVASCQSTQPRPAVLRVAPAPVASSSPQPLQPRAQVRPRLFAAFQRTCYLNTAAVLRCWGADLIDGAIGRATRPQVIATGVRDVALGDTHACVVSAGGDLSCWGWDNDGALGSVPVDVCDGESQEQPCARAPSTVGGLPRVTAVAASINHTCALTAGRVVYCWGSNQTGQLGRHTVDTCDQRLCSRQPGVVEGLDRVSALAVGEGFGCALRDDGKVWCWGSNDQGELGRGTVDDQTHLSPRPVRLPRKALSIEAGSHHVCALTA